MGTSVEAFLGQRAALRNEQSGARSIGTATARSTNSFALSALDHIGDRALFKRQLPLRVLGSS